MPPVDTITLFWSAEEEWTDAACFAFFSPNRVRLLHFQPSSSRTHNHRHLRHHALYQALGQEGPATPSAMRPELFPRSNIVIYMSVAKSLAMPTSFVSTQLASTCSLWYCAEIVSILTTANAQYRRKNYNLSPNFDDRRAADASPARWTLTRVMTDTGSVCASR